ncbi:MAG: hypothetical protein QOH70_471 [Blastocatellia bacterium]|jgi:hypothetical protein|nr:hypothetical protein [Blastocatellia bacterium]
MRRFSKSSKQLAREQDEAITFQFAIGTYDKVIDWYNRGLIDIGILSAMPMSDLLTTIKDPAQKDFKKITDAYLGRINPVGGRAPAH